jgi:hypothetical protein
MSLKNELPSNPQAIFIQRKQLNEENRRRKERTTAMSKKELFRLINKDRVEAERLKTQYNIKIKEDLEQRAGVQLSNFCMKKEAFHEFKKMASIERTLNHFNGLGDKKFVKRKQSPNEDSDIEQGGITLQAEPENVLNPVKSIKIEHDYQPFHIECN